MKSVRIKVYGIVQGVGMRPTVARHASACAVTGYVCNKGPFVEIRAQGEEDDVKKFIDKIKYEPPKRSAVLKMDIKEKDPDEKYKTFEIIESSKVEGEIFVSPDIAICDECLSELYDKNDRRYLHPFINCTSCGPRLTILDSLPYDRPRTSMRKFPMCSVCEKEYYDPSSRRYDAQPVCCNDCGPSVYIAGTDIKGEEAIRTARSAVALGKVIAVKGIGGFHLCCDAANDAAVERLRQLKSRPHKPFAVMMKDIDTVRRYCKTDPFKEEILTGHNKPIVLLDKKVGEGVPFLSEKVASGNPAIGVMLPYAPLHCLIFDYKDDTLVSPVLIMTSGNVSGAPIASTDEEAFSMLSGFCDLILSHDRDINIRTDDSVTDTLDGKLYMIRRSRGYAPLPMMLSKEFKGELVAYGADLKNTFCIAHDNLFYPSSYIGDMEDVRSSEVLKSSVIKMNKLLETDPEYAVCDLHPRYVSSLLAEESGRKIIRVQHHYAHILSCMAENDYTDEVIGIALDGTGFGEDDTIWGGEILRCSLDGFERAGSIAPFDHCGGDLASREGYRIALSMIGSIYKDGREDVIRVLDLCDLNAFRAISKMIEKKINTVKSTSTGRLFDAVSAILGIRKTSTFEGHAAMELQFAAEKNINEPVIPDIEYVRSESGRKIVATDEIVRFITDERIKGEDPYKLAMTFHLMLAEGAARCALDAAGDIDTFALSGGCFQNKLLLTEVKKRLEKEGKKVLIHSVVPPNDGGVALGQALYGMNKLSKIGG